MNAGAEIPRIEISQISEPARPVRARAARIPKGTPTPKARHRAGTNRITLLRKRVAVWGQGETGSRWTIYVDG